MYSVKNERHVGVLGAGIQEASNERNVGGRRTAILRRAHSPDSEIRRNENNRQAHLGSDKPGMFASTNVAERKGAEMKDKNSRELCRYSETGEDRQWQG